MPVLDFLRPIRSSGHSAQEAFEEAQRLMVQQHEQDRRDQEERRRLENTHPIDSKGLISLPFGRQCKVVKKFRVGDTNMVVITDYRQLNPGTIRKFFVKKYDPEKNIAYSSELPYKLEALALFSIKQAVQNARRVLTHA